VQTRHRQVQGAALSRQRHPAQARELYKRNLLRHHHRCERRSRCRSSRNSTRPAPAAGSLALGAALGIADPYRISQEHGRRRVAVDLDHRRGQFWGLFACHHYSARCPTFERRSVAELFAQMFSMRLESRERQETVDYERRARDISDQLLGAVASDETLLKDPDWLGDILTNAIPADGVGVWIGGNHAFSGDTRRPTISAGSSARSTARRRARSSRPTISPRSCPAPRISPDGRRACWRSRSRARRAIMSCCSARSSFGRCAGPAIRTSRSNMAQRPAPDAARKLRGVEGDWSRAAPQPFTGPSSASPRRLRATLIEVVLRLADEASAERQQASARQEVLIAELNHRVRNILGVIRGLIRQSQPTDDDMVEDFVQGRRWPHPCAGARAQPDHRRSLGPRADPGADRCRGRRLRRDGSDTGHCQGEPVLLNPQAYSTMALVVHELVTNSTKYGSLSATDGRVTIGWQRDGAGDLVLELARAGRPAGPALRPARASARRSSIARCPTISAARRAFDYFPKASRHRSASRRRHVSEPQGLCRAGDQISAPSLATHQAAPTNMC
jgi:hypothetical protein